MSAQKSEHPDITNQPLQEESPDFPAVANGVNGKPARQATVTLDPLAAASVYYGQSHTRNERVRTYSSVIESATRQANWLGKDFKQPARRTSHDERGSVPRRFIIPVKSTYLRLLETEDTDKNHQITIEDLGPKVLAIGTVASGGYNRFDVRGTYKLSNLLQELTLAMDHGRQTIILDEIRLSENPVDRLSRRIKEEFWPGLTRRIDGSNINQVAKDTKDRSGNPRPRIYVPRGAPEQYEYYTGIATQHPEYDLDVQWLNEVPDDAEYVRDLNDAPGLLAVAMEEVLDEDGKKTLRGLPFVVPGGRFNELYGWDSYMESIGLLLNDRVDLVKSMVTHFCFCIRHYGKILNANRTYYLCRSQPPFLTDMALRCYSHIQHEPGALDWLREALYAAIKEYYSVWMSQPRLDSKTGLSRYFPGGKGVPPETEATHFAGVIDPRADALKMTPDEYVRAYNYGEVKDQFLDDYFKHDRAVRESGHDTSYRLEGVAADLATVDLNSLLYKYEVDIAQTIREKFNDKLPIPDHWLAPGQKSGHVESSAAWDRRARKRRLMVDKYLWNEEKGLYVDYNTATQRQQLYKCATTFWPMWAGLCTPRQAAVIVRDTLPELEAFGGILSGTEESRGEVSLTRPNRQWDFPYGWAPQQMLAWVGLQRYGFEEEVQRLSYKWLYMVTKAFVDFNGVVVEKYDVTRQVDPHKVEAEYGNQGADFKGVAKEGFGWVNASYVLGLSLVNGHMKRALGTITTWEQYVNAIETLGVAIDD